MISRRKSLGFIAATSLVFFASCGPTPQLRVHDAVVRLSPVNENPSALYFTVLGGPKDVYLEEVVSRSALRTEMHESKMENGMMSMSPIDRVLIPAKGKVEFKQGGKHVMVWGVNLIPRRLGEMDIELVFSTGDRILVEAKVTKMDGSDPDEKQALN